MGTLDTAEAIRNYYACVLKEHGPTARGMSYRSEETHEQRLKKAVELTQSYFHKGLPVPTILDVGCGVGLLPAELWSVGGWWKYSGIDLVQEAVDVANDAMASYGSPTNALVQDFLDPEYTPTADVIYMIGTMGFQPASRAIAMMDKAWKLCNKAFCFTMLLNRPLSRQALQWWRQVKNPKVWATYEGHVPGEIIVLAGKE